MPSRAIEDYLKTIYKAEQKSAKVTNSQVAVQMGVKPASATAMIKKLAKQNLVTHEPYHGIQLTDAGRKIALEVLRHHRLIELYLSEALGVPWDKVHAEAENLEHAISEELEDRMDAALGHPSFDPHGAPIPSRDGAIAVRDKIPLSQLPVGESARVVEVSDDDPNMLRYLTSLGVRLDTELHLLGLAPFEGPLTLRIGDNEHSISRIVANNVFVGT
jgi:DtxR family transcriptional regulator, Mn-dependent transcriptional regulator